MWLYITCVSGQCVHQHETELSALQPQVTSLSSQALGEKNTTLPLAAWIIA